MSTTTWTIDPAHTTIGFSVRHMMFTKVRGSFSEFESTVHLDPADWTKSSVETRIDASSIDTGNPQRDEHLRSPDFFDVENFPELIFRSGEVEVVGDNDLKVHGQLTIRDETRPITLDVESSGVGRDPWGNLRRGFTVRTTLERKDFGLEWNQTLDTGGVLVGNKVEVEIDVQLVAQDAAEDAAEEAAA